MCRICGYFHEFPEIVLKFVKFVIDTAELINPSQLMCEIGALYRCQSGELSAVTCHRTNRVLLRLRSCKSIDFSGLINLADIQKSLAAGWSQLYVCVMCIVTRPVTGRSLRIETVSRSEGESTNKQ